METMPVIVQKMYDLVIWLMGKCAKFPRDQRYILGERICDAALDILENLIDAVFAKDKTELLRLANRRLERLRFMMRLSKDMRFIDLRAYEFQAKAVNEIGRMIGGWIKQAQKKETGPAGLNAPESPRPRTRGESV